MQNSLVEILIGAAVLGVAAVFLTFAYTSTGTGTVYGYEISAPFSRVDGITVGSDVRMSGIKIGTVSRLELDQRRHFKAPLRAEHGNSILILPQPQPNRRAIIGQNRGDVGSSVTVVIFQAKGHDARVSGEFQRFIEARPIERPDVDLTIDQGQ